MTTEHPMFPPVSGIKGFYYPTGVTPEQFFQAYCNAANINGNDILTGIAVLTFHTERLADDMQLLLSATGEQPEVGIRACLERLIVHMIEALDVLCGDPEAEPEPLEGHDDAEDGDPAEDDGTAEPSLGAIEKHPSEFMLFDGRNRTGDQSSWGASGTDDREEDAGDECEIDMDYEPWLGSFDRHVNQEHAYSNRAGNYSDFEHDDADREGTETLLPECADGLEAFR